MNKYLEYYNILPEVYELMVKCEKELASKFQEIEALEFTNSLKVLSAFKKFDVNESDFSASTGYGYNDIGRDKIESIFACILGGEKALVRNQFISGSHALTVTFFALLRPNDTMLSITGLPYDTLHEVIGIKENPSSLKSFNINYEQVDLINDDFDYQSIEKVIKEKEIKLIEIQRSIGYSTRKSITIDKVEKVIKFIKDINPNIIIMVDNCYCEFVEAKSPLEVGADVMVGSLIKNLGGGIAPNGAYVAGKSSLIDLCAERLSLPGEGAEVGPSLGINKEFLMGIYHAPSVVASSLKVALLTSAMLEKLNIKTSPKSTDLRADIVQTIIFGNSQDLIKYCEGIQAGSAIDSNSVPIPTETPGYDDKIIMASGSFTQGSSIEISCDGPLREPYILYQQGSLTYDYGKIAVMVAISRIITAK